MGDVTPPKPATPDGAAVTAQPRTPEQDFDYAIERLEKTLQFPSFRIQQDDMEKLVGILKRFRAEAAAAPAALDANRLHHALFLAGQQIPMVDVEWAVKEYIMESEAAGKGERLAAEPPELHGGYQMVAAADLAERVAQPPPPDISTVPPPTEQRICVCHDDVHLIYNHAERPRGVTPALDVERLARLYMSIRGAHGPNGQVEDQGQPCEWCRLAAQQHVEAAAEYNRLAGSLPMVARPSGSVSE